MSNRKNVTFFLGKVLWWSKRDGNGIIIDPLRNEHYFDVSMLKDRGDFLNKNRKLIIYGDCLVQFQIAKDIKHISCCSEVRILPKSKNQKLKKEFFKESTL